ncbi:phage head closure protein [[Empedobacter] haloabium]|uniref:Phage head closure protein n=1 Tax=[Empedobacter] haloabium TaxID=592317 RepID=A0ABZ1UUB0_9BURK
MPKNSRITIQQRAEGQASDGQPVDTWTDVATVWADIRDITGREYVVAGAERSEVTTKIRIWRRAGITAGMRVLRGVIVYDVQAVLDEGRDTTLLMCTKGTS